MGVEVQQSLAFRRLVDLFWQLVGPNRLSLKGALQHLFVTCPVLSPEHEKQALEGGILVEGGLVSQFPCAREVSVKKVAVVAEESGHKAKTSALGASRWIWNPCCCCWKGEERGPHGDIPWNHAV